jgi:integrase
LAPKTLVDLRWSLERHLLPHFAGFRLSAIDARAIDAYKLAKLRTREQIEAARAEALTGDERFSERPLANSSINHTLRHLAQILETAVEYELIPSNPATGKRRRLKAARPARPWVEPEQLPALLDASSGVGRVLLALLAGAGLRIGEALALRWSHVDLGTASLHVVVGKTAAAVRIVDLTPALREKLILWRAESDFTAPDDYVIATSSGRKHNPPRCPAAGGRGGERRARQERDRAHRADHLPLAPPDVCEPPLRLRRRHPLRERPTRPRGPALQPTGLRAGDEAP